MVTDFLAACYARGNTEGDILYTNEIEDGE